MQQPAVPTVSNEELRQVKETFDRLRSALGENIVGQDRVIDQLLTAVLADGHVLLEGVPGTAKTMLVKTTAALVGANFGRVQLTPDMLPSDILGTNVYDLTSRTFTLAQRSNLHGHAIWPMKSTAPPPRRSQHC
jgi:MoxR-like ATPase